jgi:hypothetical protein
VAGIGCCGHGSIHTLDNGHGWQAGGWLIDGGFPKEHFVSDRPVTRLACCDLIATPPSPSVNLQCVNCVRTCRPCVCRELALESGIKKWGRVPALNTNPRFIEDLADAVVSTACHSMAQHGMAQQGTPLEQHSLAQQQQQHSSSNTACNSFHTGSG